MLLCVDTKFKIFWGAHDLMMSTLKKKKNKTNMESGRRLGRRKHTQTGRKESKIIHAATIIITKSTFTFYMIVYVYPKKKKKGKRDLNNYDDNDNVNNNNKKCVYRGKK